MKIAYKLVHLRKNGTLGPLFINRKYVYTLGKWHIAETIPTKGFALRPGFHVCAKPLAPHLTLRDRVWVKVKIKNYTKHQRPTAQGGLWYTADQLFIEEVL